MPNFLDMPLQDQRLLYVMKTRKFLELLRPGTEEARKAALGMQYCMAWTVHCLTRTLRMAVRCRAGQSRHATPEGCLFQRHEGFLMSLQSAFARR